MLLFKVATFNVASSFPVHFIFLSFNRFFPLMIFSLPASLQSCTEKCCHPAAFPERIPGTGSCERPESKTPHPSLSSQSRGAAKGVQEMQFWDLQALWFSMPNMIISNQRYDDSKDPAKHIDYSLLNPVCLQANRLSVADALEKTLILFH